MDAAEITPLAGDALRAELVEGNELLGRVGDLPVAAETQAHIRQLLRALIEARR